MMQLSFAFFAQVAFKSTVLLAAVWVLLLLLRRKSAAQRHQLWSLALAAVFTLPFLASALPAWRIPLRDSLLTNMFVFQMEAQAKQASGMRAGSSDAANFYSWNGGALLILWSLGAAASLAQMSIGWVTVERMRRKTSAFALPEFASLAREIGVTQKVELRQSSAMSMPITFGFQRPTIFLPADAIAWTDERRRAVLLHELAHVKRYDGAAQMLARLTLALYWWHPLVWAAWREFLRERERAADDLVLSLGSNAPEYAGHLLAMGRALRVTDSLGWAAMAMARPSQLEDRITAILDTKRERKIPRRGMAMAAFAGVIVAAPWAVLQGDARPSKNVADAEDRASVVRGAVAAYRARAAQPFGTDSYKIGGDVAAPTLLTKVEPEYSDAARLAKYSGTVLLEVEIGSDGLPKDVRVIRPLGMGLDEKAVEAVSQWTFKPGTLNGQPVPVAANVEVSFRLQ